MRIHERQRSGPVRWRGPGSQQPVEFDDPLVEAGQFIGALDGVGGVGVIADRAAVVPDLGLQSIASFADAVQLSADALVRLTRKPRGLNFLAQCCRPVFRPNGGCRREMPRLYCT